MKQFVIASLISIAILLLLPYSTAYADENTDYNIWMVMNDEGYLQGYPHWCGRSSLVITNKPAGLKVALVYLKNTDTNKFGFTFFCYSNSAQDINFSALTCGNHNRGGSKYNSIDSAKSLYWGEYKTAYTASNPLHTITGSDGLDYYVWYPDVIYENGVDKKYDYFEYDGFNAVYYFEGNDFTMSSVIASCLNGTAPRVEIDNNGNLIKNVVYDLELPLNVSCKDDGKYNTLTWEQSDGVDVTGWQVEIYVKQKGKYGKYIWSFLNKKDYETDWNYLDSVYNYLQKYKTNTLKYKFNNEYLETTLGYLPQIVEVSDNDYMIRNVWVDTATDTTHYSNYVYLNQDADGNYIANEVNGESLDNSLNGGTFTDSSIAENVNSNSDIYDNDDVSNSSENTKGAIATLKSLLNDLKGFPSLFSDFFGFLPDYLTVSIYAFLIALIPICLIKLLTN